MNNTYRNIIGGLLVAVVVAGGWYALAHPGSANAQTVAVVNGTAITQGQLASEEAQIGAQMGATGTSTAMFKDAALNALIGTTLLKQEAAKAGYTASSSEIDSKLAAVKAQFKTTQDYQNALKTQDLTEPQLRLEIADNLVIGSFLQSKLNLNAATATEAEIQAAYQAQAAQQPKGSKMPTLAQVHDQIAQMIVQQKQQQAVAQYIDQLRSAATIKILISTSTPTTTTSGLTPSAGSATSSSTTTP